MRSIYLVVPFLVPLGLAIGLFFSKKAERETLVLPYGSLPPEFKREFEKLFSKAMGEALAITLRQLSVEFEIKDGVEAELLVVSVPQNSEKTLGFCFVKPSRVAAAARFYEKQFDNGVLRYARVETPASRPLGIILTGKERLEVVYDREAGKWVERPGALEDENEAVREAVEDAIKKIQQKQ
jgi:hypothetical protein